MLTRECTPLSPGQAGSEAELLRGAATPRSLTHLLEILPFLLEALGPLGPVLLL